jgi:hypothetical protein
MLVSQMHLDKVSLHFSATLKIWSSSHSRAVRHVNNKCFLLNWMVLLMLCSMTDDHHLKSSFRNYNVEVGASPTG